MMKRRDFLAGLCALAVATPSVGQMVINRPRVVQAVKPGLLKPLDLPASVPIPAGLGYSPSDFVIYDLNGKSYTTFDMGAVKPVPDYIYYCSPTGNASASPASNDPNTPITPRRVRDLANAHGGVIQVYLAGGQYYGNIGFDGNNFTCAGLIVEGWSGQGTGRPLLIKRNTNQAIPLPPATNAWTFDQGTTYSTVHVTGGTSGVWDLVNKDMRGAYTRLPYAPDLATCRATPGTCWWNGATDSTGRMYVNPIDGRSLIGDQSTMIVSTNSRAFLYNRSGNAVCWMKGVDIIGGTAFQIQTAATNGKFYAEDCGFYGGDGSSTGSLSVLGNIEFRVKRCIFGGSVEDSFNRHGNTTGDAKGLIEDGWGIFSGYNATGANNVTTAHENCITIEVGCTFMGAQNRTVHHIQNSKTFMVRPRVYASKATDTTGVTIVAGSAAGQSTEIWIWGLGAGGIENSVQGGFYAYAGSSIRYANGDFSGITVAPGSAGTIGSYVP